MSTYREYQRVIKLAISSPSSSEDSSSHKNGTDSDRHQNNHRHQHTQDQLMDLSSRSDSSLSSVNSDSEISDDSNSEKKSVSKRKITRTKTGCFCCRKRKKKCDEIKPRCSGCIRNDLTCVYPSANEIKKPASKKPSSANTISSTSMNAKALAKVVSMEYEKSKLESEFTNNTPPVSPKVSEKDESEIKEYISPLTSPSLQPCSDNYNHSEIRPLTTFSTTSPNSKIKSFNSITPPPSSSSITAKNISALPITFSNASRYLTASSSNASSESSYQYLSEIRSTSHLYPEQISIKSLLN